VPPTNSTHPYIPPLLSIFIHKTKPIEKTVAITGSTGHLAASVIPLLISRGFRVRALQHAQVPAFHSDHTENIKGSISDSASLDELVRDCSIVIHCAAKISINSNRDHALYETNVNGTRNILNAAKRANVKRFIYTSSIHAYNQLPLNELLDETRAYASNRAPRYDQSKRDAQQLVLQESSEDMETVVLNPTAVVGPFDFRPSLMGQAVMDIYTRKVPSLIRGGFDFVDVRDVALGIVNAIDKGRNGQSYLLSGKWHSLDELQQMIFSVKGEQRRLPVLPVWAGYLGLPFAQMLATIKKQQPLYTKESLLTLVNGNKNISSEKACRELGFVARPFPETVADTISWFKQTGYLT